jgi:hypothetical protein
MSLEFRVIQGLKDANTIEIIQYRNGPLFVARSEPLSRRIRGRRAAVRG